MPSASGNSSSPIARSRIGFRTSSARNAAKKFSTAETMNTEDHPERGAMMLPSDNALGSIHRAAQQPAPSTLLMHHAR